MGEKGACVIPYGIGLNNLDNTLCMLNRKKAVRFFFQLFHKKTNYELYGLSHQQMAIFLYINDLLQP